jgi:DNA-binding transcriptional ArsR family regulator
MTDRGNIPYDALERLFHEPNRLAIMSSLLGATGGQTFGELKKACSLTDGNLSRHLTTLESAGVVTITKDFVGKRPRTTVVLSEDGQKRFLQYIEALEAVLKEAAAKLKDTEKETADAVAPFGTELVRT